MSLKQALKNEIDSLKAVIIVLGFQSTSKMNGIMEVAKDHLKTLNKNLKQINSKAPTPDIDGLTFEERVELHLESARTFIESVTRGLNGCQNSQKSR